jgi:RHS repeat-associated protein
VKKVEGNITTYYVRSTVLGNQVVADLDDSGRVVRSYIYTGRQLLAVKDQAGLAWVHSDPVTKSKRLTNEEGRVTSGVELDPWGNETADSFDSTQPKKDTRRFTTYERDANGSDDAMHRRYNAWRGRFEQPDPFRGSVNPVNPQSLNRYSYTQNDPVNHTDPSGLMTSGCWGWGYSDGYDYGWACVDYDPWGGYNPDPPPPPGPPYDPRADFRDYARQLLADSSMSNCLKLSLMIYKAGQVWGGSDAFQNSGNIINGLLAGLTEFSSVSFSGRTSSDSNYRVGVFASDPYFGGGFHASGFSGQFSDPSNQVRHFTAYLATGYSLGIPAAYAALYANEGTSSSSVPDVALGEVAASLGGNFFGDFRQLAQDVWHQVCGQSSDLSLP